MAAHAGRLAGWRQLIAADARCLSDFLDRYWQHTLFLKGTFLGHGVSVSDDPESADFWGSFQNNQLCAVLACSVQGAVLTYLSPEFTLQGFPISDLLKGRKIQSGIGPPRQIAPILADVQPLDMAEPLTKLEPLMWLDIQDLKCPDLGRRTALKLRRVTEQDRALLMEWSAGYLTDIQASGKPIDMVTRILKGGAGRILEWNGLAVGLSNLSAQGPDMVQIADVYVPPAWRGRRFGDAVVGAHLLHLAEHAGISGALLSSASARATRVYHRMGFDVIAEYAHLTCTAPFVVDAETRRDAV